MKTSSQRSGGAYSKLERKVGDYAVAAAAAQITLDADGTVTQVGIGLTNVANQPVRAVTAENALRGARPTEEALRGAAELAREATNPSSDLRGPAEYERAMAQTMTARALRCAVERAMQAQ